MEKKECILEKVTEAEWSSTDLPPTGEGKEGSPQESQKPGELALDLLKLACLHESDFATLRLTSVAIHSSELFEEIECTSLGSAFNIEHPTNASIYQ